jgi:hypothetical protein
MGQPWRMFCSGENKTLVPIEHPPAAAPGAIEASQLATDTGPMPGMGGNPGARRLRVEPEARGDLDGTKRPKIGYFMTQ